MSITVIAHVGLCLQTDPKLNWTADPGVVVKLLFSGNSVFVGSGGGGGIGNVTVQDDGYPCLLFGTVLGCPAILDRHIDWE